MNRVFSEAQFWDGRAASLDKISKIAGYKPLFKAAFGDDKVTIDRIGKAIATFERTVVAGNSPYDRYQDGDKSALSPSATRGMELFTGKAKCSVCHAGFNFADEKYHNLGVGIDKTPVDKGREEFTKKAEDRGQYKTPTLRNIADTAPYMHDGSEKTLEDTVEFYNKGGVKNPNLDKEMKPLNLTDQEKADLVAFMKALSGEVTQVAVPAPVD